MKICMEQNANGDEILCETKERERERERELKE